MIKRCDHCGGSGAYYLSVSTLVDFCLATNENAEIDTTQSKITCQNCKGVGKTREGEHTPVSDFSLEFAQRIHRLQQQNRIILNLKQGWAMMTIPDIVSMAIRIMPVVDASGVMNTMLKEATEVGRILEQEYNWLVRY